MFDSIDQYRILKSTKFWLGFILVLIFYSPYVIMGQDSVWYANDYLELVIPWFKLLVDNNAIFQPNEFMIEGMLDKLPRGSFASEFYLKTWLFYFFEPFQAILINKLLIHLIAYLSAFYFLSKVSKGFIQGPIFIYALLWACLPFWPEAGIGLAFVPVIFVVFRDLIAGKKLGVDHLFFIFLYCFYSNFHLNGIFITILVFLIGSLDFIKNSTFRFGYWLAWLILTLVCLLVNYRLFDIYFFQRDWFIPHRVEYDIYSFERYHVSFWGKIKQILLFGEIHAVIVSPLLYLTIVGYLVFTRFIGSGNKKRVFLFRVFIGINVVAVLAALVIYLPFVEKFPVLVKVNQFSFERFYYLIYPFLVLSFVLVIDELLFTNRLGKIGWLLLFSVLVYNFFVLDDNVKNKVTKQVFGMGERYPTYRQFYAVEQFSEIRKLLDTQSGQEYKVASIGMHPAIAIYNGLHSIDGYTGNYSLDHKNRIFEVIQNELGSDDRENWLYWHLKGWGNKAYLFNQTNKDDFMRFKWFEEIPVIKPKYDYNKLKSMGCYFILSAGPILDDENLLFLKKSVNKDSAWNVYIYGIK